MNFKKIATTIELLAITSVVSVGFSAWAIVETTFPTVTATIETENIINNKNCLTINNMIFSDYDEKGFFKDFIYTDPSTAVIGTDRLYTGYLDVEVEIHISNCIEYISNGNYKFTFELSNNASDTSPVNIIAKASATSGSLVLTASCSDSNVIINEPVNVENPTSNNSYTLINSVSFSNNATTGSMFLNLTYGITLSSGDFSSMYSNISDGTYSGISFNLKAYLEQGGN